MGRAVSGCGSAVEADCSQIFHTACSAWAGERWVDSCCNWRGEPPLCSGHANDIFHCFGYREVAMLELIILDNEPEITGDYNFRMHKFIDSRPGA